MEYVFEVSALRDDMLGNPSTIVVQTEGMNVVDMDLGSECAID